MDACRTRTISLSQQSGNRRRRGRGLVRLTPIYVALVLTECTADAVTSAAQRVSIRLEEMPGCTQTEAGCGLISEI